MAAARYVCWCDGSACDGSTDVAFTTCPECQAGGHRALPRPEGLNDDDVKVKN